MPPFSGPNNENDDRFQDESSFNLFSELSRCRNEPQLIAYATLYGRSFSPEEANQIRARWDELKSAADVQRTFMRDDFQALLSGKTSAS